MNKYMIATAYSTPYDEVSCFVMPVPQSEHSAWMVKLYESARVGKQLVGAGIEVATFDYSGTWVSDDGMVSWLGADEYYSLTDALSHGEVVHVERDSAPEGLDTSCDECVTSCYDDKLEVGDATFSWRALAEYDDMRYHTQNFRLSSMAGNVISQNNA